MEAFMTKQEEKLYKALETLLVNSITSTGRPKKATIDDLRRAQEALIDYERCERKNRKS